MKRSIIFPAILISLLYLFVTMSCSKDENSKKSDNDSIALYYVKLDTPNDTIEFPGNLKAFFEFYTIIFYHGPHPYERTDINIRTSNASELLLSTGNYSYAPLLNRDSIIDTSIYWQSELIVVQYFDFYNKISISRKYVGIKCIKGGKTYFGWAKCSDENNNSVYLFHEYAIDTSSINHGVVRVGRKFKS
jgi:hypothetical protein